MTDNLGPNGSVVVDDGCGRFGTADRAGLRVEQPDDERLVADMIELASRLGLYFLA